MLSDSHIENLSTFFQHHIYKSISYLFLKRIYALPFRHFIAKNNLKIYPQLSHRVAISQIEISTSLIGSIRYRIFINCQTTLPIPVSV